MQYHHTLIPNSSDFIPAPTQVQKFLESMVKMGVIGSEPVILFIVPTGETREVTNPFTVEAHTIPVKKHIDLKHTSEICESIKSRNEYYIGVNGVGKPRVPPVSIEFDEPYHVGVNCRLASVLTSTSDLHAESKSPHSVPFYGTPHDGVSRDGFFSNPENLEVTKVPDAGSAYFWIEFELGKFLFPKIKNNDLKILNQQIVEVAEQVFNQSFAQGCYWG